MRRAALVGATLLACRVAAPDSVADPVEPFVATPLPALAIPKSAHAWPEHTFAVALPPTTNAPWLLPVFEPGRSHPLEQLELVAHGDDVALARKGDLVLATRRDRGLAGALKLPPEPLWVGIAGGDAILVATQAGALHRADTLEQALQSGLAQVGEVRGATQWDAAGTTIAAVKAGELAVSHDGGHTFVRTTPVAGAMIEQLAVRHDGVIAIRARPRRGAARTLLSKDGARWTKSPWQPDHIAREGAWIVGSDARDGVLDDDGEGWIEVILEPLEDGVRAWAADFGANARTFAPRNAARPHANEPRSPFAGERLTGHREGPGVGEMGLGGGGFGTLGTRACRGPACLHGTLGDPPLPSAIDLHAFDDLRCATAADPCPPDSWQPGHVAVFDHRDAHVVVAPLPTACRELEIRDMRGLAIAACRHERGTTIFAIDAQGRVAPELELPGGDGPQPAVQYASMADDGTIAVPEDPACERWARAWIRMPHPVGSAAPWREVVHEGARAWRVLPSGTALAIVQDTGDPMRAEVWVDRGRGVQERLVADVHVDGQPYDVEVVDGRVVFEYDDARALQTDGSLVAVAPLPRHERVADGVVISEARPWLQCE